MPGGFSLGLCQCGVWRNRCSGHAPGYNPGPRGYAGPRSLLFRCCQETGLQPATMPAMTWGGIGPGAGMISDRGTRISCAQNFRLPAPGGVERTISRLTRSMRRSSRRSATHGATGLSRWALTLASSFLHRAASGVAIESTRWRSCRSWSVRPGEYDAVLRPQPARTARATRTAIVSDSVRLMPCPRKRGVQPTIHPTNPPASDLLSRADGPWLHLSYARRGRRNT